ncbi:delta-class carbonic anhydrase [Duganella fentianensis]|uniref:delta-class carbonic anhydrase n=1 Tax=Duganella fentianensis TaxID=2692177 RepID=UPI0032B2E590
MKTPYALTMLALALSVPAFASDAQHGGSDTVAAQNAALSRNTEGKGYGPQAPRDLNAKGGSNLRVFTAAPPASKMNLCNIHFHKNAEHKGGEFTVPADSGFKYAGKLTPAEAAPLSAEVCPSEHGGLQAGDTIELHYVHSTAQVTPGPTLNSCLSEADSNPQLRVEAQVMVLVNDAKAADFAQLTKLGEVGGYQQALHIPKHMGKPIQYAGSTTGPSYNEKGSPLQVSWSVRPKVLKVNAESVGAWCKANVFKEDHGHGVRNLVIDAKLLAPMN